MPNIVLRKLYYYLPILVWTLIIFSLSSQPTGSTSRIDWQDFVIKKLAHIFVYGVLALLLYRAFRQEKIKPIHAGYLAIVLSALYGLTDEFHQSFTPGREPRLRDVGFDTIGASIAIYTIWKLLPKMPQRLQSLAKKLELN